MTVDPLVEKMVNTGRKDGGKDEGEVDARRAHERSLIVRIKAGERHLFHELVKPYERSIYLVAYSILRNEADAEDVAQETMVKVISYLDQLRVEDKFKGWLLQIATNEARLKLRKDRRHLYESIEDDGAEGEEGEFMPRQFADWREVPSEALEREEIKRAIVAALTKLPDKYREVFVLRDVQHMNVNETAKILEISIPSVKTRLHRARLMVREELAPMFQQRWTDRLQFWKGKKPW